MEIKASDVKKYVENLGNYFKNISDTDLQVMIENMNNVKYDRSFNKQDFFDSKNDFITHMSKEKNMTIKEYNDKYITLIGECCALDKIGFVSLDKNEVPYQVCDYIDYLEQEYRSKKEKVRELAYKIKFNEKSRRKMQRQLMKQIDTLEQQVKKQKEVINRILNETKETRNILNNNRDNNMLSKSCLLSYLEIVEDLRLNRDFEEISKEN